ncbi:MAG: hypothetical protein PHI12_08805 [Dehalococcoidales bacterium]|nr:hypothetical protein [Dehalococcoidales bacterium]
MNKLDLAYIGGLFDGEGNIQIVKRSPLSNRRDTYHLVVRVCLVEDYIPKWLAFAFGGSVNKRLREQVNPHHRDVYTWYCSQQIAANFLRAVLPYLKLKKAQAEIALKFQERKRCGRPRKVNGTFTPKTEGELAVEEAEYILMKQLKHQKY